LVGVVYVPRMGILVSKCERNVDFGGRFPVEVGMELFVSPCYILLFFLCPPLPSPRELSGIGPSLSIELESSFLRADTK